MTILEGGFILAIRSIMMSTLMGAALVATLVTASVTTLGTAALAADDTQTFAEALPGERILEGIRAAEDATAALERNANKQLTLETMLIKVAQL